MQIQIAIDGRHYCEYVHRIPYTQVDTLQIQGDIRVSMIDFQIQQMYPPVPSINRLNVVNPVGSATIKSSFNSIITNQLVHSLCRLCRQLTGTWR